MQKLSSRVAELAENLEQASAQSKIDHEAIRELYQFTFLDEIAKDIEELRSQITRNNEEFREQVESLKMQLYLTLLPSAKAFTNAI